MGDIDTHNNSFRTVIEKLQGRVTKLEGNSGSGESHLIYPQKWATGDGTVSNPWANDCIQKAYNNTFGGGTIFLKAGYYQLAAKLLITKKINIIGEGMNKTFIVTANARGIHIDTNGDYSTLRDFTIDGDAQTDGVAGGYPISTHYVDYATFKNIEIKNGGRTGFHIEETNHSLFQNLYSHDNDGHGLHPGTDDVARGKYNTYRDIYAYDNGSNGFDGRGSSVDPDEELYNIYEHLVCWGNGTYGIAIAKQCGGSLINSVAFDNGHTGYYLFELKDFIVENCVGNFHLQRGMYIANCENFNLSNVTTKNNNISDTTNIGGIHVYGGNNIRFTSCQSYDDRTPKLQRYGMVTLTGADNIKLVECDLSGNLTGNILNSASATITALKGVADGDTPVAGDIQYFNGTNWIRLAKGTAGQVLTMNAGATAPEWQTP